MLSFIIKDSIFFLLEGFSTIANIQNYIGMPLGELIITLEQRL